MSKTVGYVLTAALVVFAIAVPIIGPTTLAAWGLSATAVTAIGAALSAAIMVNSLLMPKPKVSGNAQETTLQLGEIARRAIFGKAATAGSLVDAFNYGGKYGTDHEVVVIALADHECDSLVEFYVNDIKITYTGDGAYTQIDPTADTPHLYVYFRSGTEAQTVPSVLTDHGPGWSSSDNGAGVCYVVVDYRADAPDDKKLAFPGGRPTFLWVVKGKKCYDPRLDTTVGGSGSHRWDDPSTWAWSENPIICHYNYERGVYACDRVDQPSMLLVGRGLSATEVPPANIFANANLCDEDPGDGGVRYKVGGVVAADEKYLDVAEKFAAACGGIIIQPEGSVEIEPAQARTPSFTFTDDDILTGSTVEWNQQILSKADSEWVNTIIPRYVEPTQKWSDQSAPVRRVDADVLNDGGSREEDVVLQYVTVERQASDIGEIHRKLGRLWGRGKVVLPPEFAEIEEGDWGTWNSDRYGLSITLRVESYALDGKWQNGLTLREISSAVYDGVFGEGGSTGSTGSWDDSNPSAPPDIGTPDVANWSLAAVTLTDGTASVPALEITGDVSDDASVQAIIFEYWKDDGVIDPTTNPDDPTWSVFGTLPPTTTKVDITSIESGADYYAAVTYMVSGERGDRLVLGPVTAGTLAAGVADGAVTTAKLADNAVTYAKMQDISATKLVIGRNTAGAGDPEEITVEQLFSWITGTPAQGDIFYRDASGVARLAAGTSGKFLKTQGAGANPVWDTPSGGGGSAAWTLVDQSGAATTGSTWTWSANVANVDVTGLGSYNELLIFVKDVTASGAATRAIRVSVDNGSTFFGGASDYADIPISGATSGTSSFMNHGTGNAGARSVVGHIKNLKGAIKQCHFMAGTMRYFGNASDINAIRLTDISGSSFNFTGGSLYVFAR